MLPKSLASFRNAQELKKAKKPFTGWSFSKKSCVVNKFFRASRLSDCGHACEPFALALGINRVPLDLTTWPKT